jgi:hypothetical protein
MMTSTIEWTKQTVEHCPDGIDLLFITAGEHWIIGRWDSDHKSFTDSNNQPIYDIVLWAYIPKAPHTGYPHQGFANLAAVDAVLKLTREQAK